MSQQQPFTTSSEDFAAFLRHTNQKAVTLHTVMRLLRGDSLYWAMVTNPLVDISVEYLGVGTGGLEIPLTLQLLECRGEKGRENVRIFCEDPSVEMRDSFMAAARAAGVGDLVAEFSLDRLEMYSHQTVILSVASHMMYYVTDWHGALDGIARAAQRGMALVMLQSETSDNYAFRSVWSPRLHPGAVEHKGETIGTVLDQLGVIHGIGVVTCETDISECFRHGRFDPSEEGAALLGFLTRRPWASIARKDQDAIGRDLTAIAVRNGRPVMLFRDAYVTIPGGIARRPVLLGRSSTRSPVAGGLAAPRTMGV
jgi:hypothetical protein